jgi:lipid-binding SYLF domain-containing protein
MKRISLLMVVIVLVGLPAFAQKDENNRIRNSGQVMVEILNVPDNIPQSLLDKAECVIVLPSVLKFAIGFGGSYGRGVMTCRSGPGFSGRWSAPSMMALEGGSFGLQLGGQATDFVLLVMNQRGASSILTSQVKLGGDVAAAAGPKGRDAASTDVTMRAEVQFCPTRVREDCSPGSLWKAQLSAPITTATRGSTEKESPRRTS